MVRFPLIICMKKRLDISVVVGSVTGVAIAYACKHWLDMVENYVVKCHVRRTFQLKQWQIVSVDFRLYVHLEAFKAICEVQVFRLPF